MDNKQRVPADLATVNIREDWQLEYWARKFECTTTELLAAVMRVGTSTHLLKPTIQAMKSRVSTSEPGNIPRFATSHRGGRFVGGLRAMAAILKRSLADGLGGRPAKANGS